MPKSKGTMPITGTSVGTAVWIEAIDAIIEFWPRVAADPGTSVWVSSFPAM